MFLWIAWFETPLQLESEYKDIPHTSSIIADLFLSREKALSYYLFIQKYINFWILLLGLVMLFALLIIILELRIEADSIPTILVRVPRLILIIMLIPIFHISLFKELCKRFSYLFLIGNAFVLGTVYAIIYQMDIWIKM